MAEQQVFATKGNLILYKKALKLAALGYELLDRKRNILIRELMSLVDKAGELRGSIEDTYKEAYSALQLANISMGLVTPYANCIPVETGVEISTRSVMGVELPKVTLKERPLKVTYGFSQTDSQLDRAYLAFEKVKQTTAVLAEVENSIYRLSVAIKKTQRRANALQNIIIRENSSLSFSSRESVMNFTMCSFLGMIMFCLLWGRSLSVTGISRHNFINATPLYCTNKL